MKISEFRELVNNLRNAVGMSSASEEAKEAINLFSATLSHQLTHLDNIIVDAKTMVEKLELDAKEQADRYGDDEEEDEDDTGIFVVKGDWVVKDSDDRVLLTTDIDGPYSYPFFTYWSVVSDSTYKNNSPVCFRSEKQALTFLRKIGIKGTAHEASTLFANKTLSLKAYTYGRNFANVYYRRYVLVYAVCAPRVDSYHWAIHCEQDEDSDDDDDKPGLILDKGCIKDKLYLNRYERDARADARSVASDAFAVPIMITKLAATRV